MKWRRSLLQLAAVGMTAFPAAVLAGDQTPVSLDPLASHRSLTGEREWRAPKYDGQTSALGWSSGTFEIPAGMEKQVRFWIQIYTKYSTTQGVIHDSDNPDQIFEVVDFGDIEKSSLPSRAKEKLKKKIVEDAKDRVAASLTKSTGEKFPVDRLRFQLGQKDRMEQAIFLSGRYMEDFEKVFREAGLPIELTRLVYVESSFNVLARSKVGASGLWQLMPGTVRPLRMIGAAVDNRNHPLSATRAAARILTDNYRKLGSWPLALTGYNHGPTGVARIVKKYGTRDLAELIRDVKSRPSFGFASRNFYASFLAAYLVEKNAPVHFPNVKWSKRFDAEEFRLPQPVKYADVLNWFGNDDSKLQLMNPHLTWKARRGYAIPQGTMITVPSERYSQALLSLGRRVRSVAGGVAGMAIKTARASEARIHRVSRGENMTEIAREYGVSLKSLLKANGMGLHDKLYTGQRLRIP